MDREPPATSGGADPTQRLSTVDGLAQLSFLVQGMLQRLAAEHDLSIIQTRLLGVLRDREPTMKELASLLSLDKSSTTGLVDRAERRGLVVRETAPNDRRSILVRLTRDGRSLVSEVAARFEAEISAMLERLSGPDRRALTRLVSALVVGHAAECGIDLFADLQTRRRDGLGESPPEHRDSLAEVRSSSAGHH